MENTITFDEQVNGWTSFYSYNPDWLLAVNNEFYSIKDGQLWVHNDPTVPRNNFYGVQYGSLVTVIFNEEPGMDKAFKSAQLESKSPWLLRASTNYTEGIIEKSEFDKRESRYYAHLRRNEQDVDLSYINAYGIGFALEVSGLNIEFSEVGHKLSIGDQLKAEINSVVVNLGTVTGVEGNSVSLDQDNNLNRAIGNFVFGLKNPRAEGGNLRGYYLEVTLQNDSLVDEELYAVNIEAAQSFT